MAHNIINGTPLNNILTGTATHDTINGLAGNDTLLGLGDNDVLDGGLGNDLLNGGTGADTMSGGFGNDTYVVDNVGDVVKDPDTILPGGVDTVASNLLFYTLGTTIENLTLTGATAINGTGNAKNNVISGNSGNNVLSGLAGNDQLKGGFGNDRLNGGTGADTMNGGFGNDTYVVDSGGDVVTDPDLVGLSGGNDTVESSITYTLGATIENLTLTGVAINGTGNTRNNILTGNSTNNVLSGLGGNDVLSGLAGNDILSGGTGNDRLTGGSGRDILTGGLGNDRFDYNAVSDSPAGAGRDAIVGFHGEGTLQGDQIDLRDIYPGTLIWGGLWTAGHVRYVGGVVQVNTDSDTAAEFEIQLVGAPALFVQAGNPNSDILL